MAETVPEFGEAADGGCYQTRPITVCSTGKYDGDVIDISDIDSVGKDEMGNMRKQNDFKEESAYGGMGKVIDLKRARCERERNQKI